MTVDVGVEVEEECFKAGSVVAEVDEDFSVVPVDVILLVVVVAVVVVGMNCVVTEERQQVVILIYLSCRHLK